MTRNREKVKSDRTVVCYIVGRLFWFYFLIFFVSIGTGVGVKALWGAYMLHYGSGVFRFSLQSNFMIECHTTGCGKSVTISFALEFRLPVHKLVVEIEFVLTAGIFRKQNYRTVCVTTSNDLFHQPTTYNCATLGRWWSVKCYQMVTVRMFEILFVV